MKTVSQPIYCNASDGSQVRNGTHRTMISPFERCWPVPNHEPLTYQTALQALKHFPSYGRSGYFRSQ
jgi:hypothetical protein